MYLYCNVLGLTVMTDCWQALHVWSVGVELACIRAVGGFTRMYIGVGILFFLQPELENGSALFGVGVLRRRPSGWMVVVFSVHCCECGTDSIA